MDATFHVETKITDDGVITQELYNLDNGAKQYVTRTAINTRERQVKEALVGLGWLPPDDRDALLEQVRELRELAIWMTGCGYDFTQHEYFRAKKSLLSCGPPSDRKEVEG